MVPVVLGATGSGKTDVAIRVAEELGGDVVVADSRQVYTGFEIGSNKPSAEERRRVSFHVVDFVDPRSQFTAFDYLQAAQTAIEGIFGGGRLAVVEGATMLYVRALTEGFNLAAVPPSPALRAELERAPLEALVQRLRDLDPTARVDERNRVRLVRAIEILQVAGAPLAAARARSEPRWRFVKLGLSLTLDELDRRLAQRSREQLARGLVEETETALAERVPVTSPVVTGVGAADVVRARRLGFTDEQLEREVIRSNQRLARRQLRWLRSDPDVTWFDAERDPVPDIVRFLRGLLN